MIGILDSLTGGEVLIILLIALMVLGPERLPETARSIGQLVAKARRMTSGLQSEVREVLDDPAMKPLRDIGEFAAAPRKKIIDFANAADAEATEARRKAEAAADAADAAEAAAVEAKAEAEAVLGDDVDLDANAESDAELNAADASEPDPEPEPEPEPEAP